jgi:hypothetical protein
MERAARSARDRVEPCPPFADRRPHRVDELDRGDGRDRPPRAPRSRARADRRR